MKKNDFKNSKSLFGSVLKDLNKRRTQDLWYQDIDWKRYLEPEMAEAILGTHFRKGTLHLDVTSTLFSHRFHYLKEALMAKLRTDYPDKTISDIRTGLKLKQ